MPCVLCNMETMDELQAVTIWASFLQDQAPDAQLLRGAADSAWPASG